MKDRLELTLRDGAPVIVRPLIEEDRPLVAEAYRRLSPDARYQRFWTRTGEMIGKEMLDRLLDQDATSHLTWALLDPAREFPGVGGASWWRNANKPDEAELSVMVLDDDQRRGIGTLLLAVMWITAFRAGVEHLVGYTLTENRSAANWMRDCGGAGEWDGYKLVFRWRLDNLDSLPETPAAADLADWLARLGPRVLGCGSSS
ncbi:MAG: GNAT family N-acetyltransferase [Luteolibacter sp.]|jgi:acetyltransferase|nr:GNAT family N-acetyltransferase [Luteolibacter sp.]